MFDYFYHSTIRKVVVAFGSMFNEIYVSRKDENGNEIERFKVPIAYGPQQKFLKRLDRQGSDLESPIKLETYLPRMGFEITNMQYDSSRKLNTIQQTAAYYANDRSQLYKRYERVPYNITLSLSIMAKTMDDALQITEQILPLFGPEYTFTIKAVDPTDQDVDIPIVFTSATLNDGDDGSYGDYSQRKVTLVNIQFIAKLYLYGPVVKQKVITATDINIFDTKFYGSTGPTYATISAHPYPGVTAGSFNPSLTAGATGYTSQGAYTTINEYPPKSLFVKPFAALLDQMPFSTGDPALDAAFLARYQALGVKKYHFIYEGAQTHTGDLVFSVSGGKGTIDPNALVTYIQESFGIVPNNPTVEYIALDFETDYDLAMSIGGGATSDTIRKGPNNVRATTQIVNAIQHAQSVFGPNVRFTEWGYPGMYNYMDSPYPGFDTGEHSDWNFASATGQEFRIETAVDQYQNVFRAFDYAMPYAYDAYPNEYTMQHALAPTGGIQYNNWWQTHYPSGYPYQDQSDKNDQRRIAAAEAAIRINDLNGTSVPIYPSVSMWYPGSGDYWENGELPYIPMAENLAFIGKLKQQKNVQGVSFWTGGGYYFNTWAFHADYPTDGVDKRNQSLLRQQIVNIYYGGVSPIPSQFSSWQDPLLKKDVMSKVNEDWLTMLGSIGITGP